MTAAATVREPMGAKWLPLRMVWTFQQERRWEMTTRYAWTTSVLAFAALACGACTVDQESGDDCTPSCRELECGDDGCGGSCGSCGSGEHCNDGACEQACTPSCGGQECGDDGCGGSCGNCGGGDTCYDGECMSPCGACTAEYCDSELRRCNGNSQCTSLLSCLSGCSSESCMDNCLMMYLGGANDLLDLLECMDDECSYEC